MKSYHPGIMLIYFKLKMGMSLSKAEQATWDRFFSGDRIKKKTTKQNIRLYKQLPEQEPWEVFIEKNNISFPALGPEQQQTADDVHSLQPLQVKRSMSIRAFTLLKAACIICVAGTLLLMNAAKQGKACYAHKGMQKTLILSDGTIVWLNADTKIRYPETFGAKERVVELCFGEATFEVAKSATRPFIVYHKEQTIQVTGTHFNMRAYSNEAAIVTTLFEGAVRIILNGQGNTLKPGQACLNTQGRLSITPADIGEATAWRNNYFTFKDKPLSEVIEEVARWYDMDVEYKDPVSDERFTIVDFPRREPVNKLLENLEASGLVHFKVLNRTILVTK